MPFASGDGQYARFNNNGTITTWGDGKKTQTFTPKTPLENAHATAKSIANRTAGFTVAVCAASRIPGPQQPAVGATCALGGIAQPLE